MTVPKCLICGVEIVRKQGEKSTNHRVAKTCKSPRCVAELRSKRGTENSKKKQSRMQTYLIVPAPLPRDETDCLIRRVETPLAEGIRLYSLHQAAWLFA